MRYFALLILGSLLSLCAQAQRQQAAADTVDNDFVIASIVMADPGDVLYSTVGHVALRMQCPSAGLDYVFSYESEPVPQKVFTFLAGNLKMGMFAVPFEDYLTIYREERRGVREYTLNLPIEVKRNLWRVCDQHVAEGPYLPYDYLERGWAHSTLMMIKEGLADTPIDYAPWPERITTHTRRELTETYVADNHPWTWFVLNMISNGSINDTCTEEDKIIMPLDLIDVLQAAKVNGVQLLQSEAKPILPADYSPRAHWCSPLLIALVLLLLTLLTIALRRSGRMHDSVLLDVMDYILLAVQTLIGALTIYLVYFSHLVCTESSMLIVPFNVLPLLLWHWRRHWCLPYAIVIAIWIACALLWPHTLTDTPYIILAAALIASYTNMYLQNRKRKQ